MEQVEYREFGGVPCIVHQPASEPVGQVVLVHGWGSTNESYKFFASLIANWRYRVIVPELPMHGKRGMMDYADARTLQTHFWSVVFQGVKEAGEIVSELTMQDRAPITMIGHSTGGFITAGTFAKQEHIRSAVVINGSCAWIEFEAHYRKRLGLPSMELDEREALQLHDPLPHFRSNPSKPLLLLHCREDTSVPVDSQRYFMNTMSELGGAAEQIRFVEYPKVDHQITLGMLQKMKEFLDDQG